jgi:hypothetical protein
MFGVPYHFLIVHFPIVFILSALFYDWRGDHALGYRFSLAGAASAGLAVISGLMLSGGRWGELTVHAGSGITGALVAVVLGVLRYSSQARNGQDMTVPSFPTAWLLIEVAAAAAIIAAAFSGHRAAL